MRRLRARPDLEEELLAQLQTKTDVIVSEQLTAEQRGKLARTSFNSARGSVWFRPVVNALRSLAGYGELCMYCSANEPSQVEHYRPIDSFPQFAFAYPNYLWTCDVCNRTYKGNKFPLDAGAGAMLINPIDENVWDYFFLDDTHGQLVPRVDEQTGEFLPKAINTRDLIGLDRETLRVRRKTRFANLKQSVEQLIASLSEAATTVAEARERTMALIDEPFQADVADFFLRGPGRSKEPFHSLLVTLGEFEALALGAQD
jgi:hypothetical protein